MYNKALHFKQLLANYSTYVCAPFSFIMYISFKKNWLVINGIEK